MANRSTTAGRLLIAAILFVAAVGGTYALVRTVPQAEQGNELPLNFSLDLKDRLAVDPSLIRFAQTALIDVPLEEVRALAVGPEDRVYVAGDQAVHVFQPDGTPHTVLGTQGQPRCLAVGSAGYALPGYIYIGTDEGIEIFNPSGEARDVWPAASDKTLLTSIAIAQDAIYAADAGEKVVLHYNTDGELIARIGQADPEREMPGFIIPSHSFDIAIGPASELYAVNPGARRVQSYTPDGELDGFWGTSSASIEGFFGCCNPAHLAILPDGRFVTSEKGIPRIKVYSILGEFDGVVAGPRELGIGLRAVGDARTSQTRRIFDIATNRLGHVLVLDPAGRQVRVFSPTGKPSPTGDGRAGDRE